MSEYLGALPAFGVTAESTTEVVLTNGQKLSMGATSQVHVRRPNGLRSDRQGTETDVSFYYDGRAISVFGRRKNLYATTPAPANNDEAIDFARDTLDLEAPGADLLYSDTYRGLMEDVISGMYVGEETIDGTPCEHLAFRGREVDFEIWIEKGARPVPRRYVIVSKNVLSDPEFRVELSNWNLDPARVTPDLFAFVPPQGAQRIQFYNVAERARTAQRRNP